MRKVLASFGATVVALTLAVGVVQASEGRAALSRQASCPEQGNWCALSRGGDSNCQQCCLSQQSYCSFYDEDEPPFYPQGCVCG